MSYGKNVDTINSSDFNYDKFKNILSNFYTKKEIGNITYYLNESNMVVAREKDNVLNLYFNHVYNSNINIPICMVIIKDFILKMGMFNCKKSDVIITGELKYDEWAVIGLNKGYNTFSHVDRMRVIRAYDDYITTDPDVLLKIVNNMDYLTKQEMDEVLPILNKIKEQLKMAEKLQIGSISTINHSINPNDTHLSSYSIPGYNFELHNYASFNGQPCGMYSQSFDVLNKNIETSSNVTITENYLKHHNYTKLYKPIIKKA